MDSRLGGYRPPPRVSQGPAGIIRSQTISEVSEMVMTFRLDCTDPARIRTTYDQCQAWSALTLDYYLVIVFTHTDLLYFCNCFVLAVCMFLYCSVSVSFVAIIFRLRGYGVPARGARVHLAGGPV